MRCPFCRFEDTQVTDSRLAGEGDVVKRRRQCKRCERRFTTYERVERLSLRVAKKDNRREDYSREKLERSFRLALTKREVPAERVEEAISDIEAQLFNMGNPEVSSDAVGELVMQKLRELDEVAYVRFASVYRNFADLAEMREMMEALHGTQGEAGLHDDVDAPHAEPTGLPEIAKPASKGKAKA